MSRTTAAPCTPDVTRNGILKILHASVLRAPRDDKQTLQQLLTPVPPETVFRNLASLWDPLQRTGAMPEMFGLPAQGPTALIQNPYLTSDRKIFDEQLKALVEEKLVAQRTGHHGSTRYALTLKGLEAAEAIATPEVTPLQIGSRIDRSSGRIL